MSRFSFGRAEQVALEVEPAKPPEPAQAVAAVRACAAAFLARGFDDFAGPCAQCGGSGRPALRIIRSHRHGGHVDCQVKPLVHRYVPPLPGTPPPALAGGPADRWCLACGQTGTQRINCQAI